MKTSGLKKLIELWTYIDQCMQLITPDPWPSLCDVSQYQLCGPVTPGVGLSSKMAVSIKIEFHIQLATSWDLNLARAIMVHPQVQGLFVLISCLLNIHVLWADFPFGLEDYQPHNIYTMLKSLYQYWQILLVKLSLLWMNTCSTETTHSYRCMLTMACGKKDYMYDCLDELHLVKQERENLIVIGRWSQQPSSC